MPALQNTQLQCGRIYKDAEINMLIYLLVNFFLLQCGRIYKDAEICIRRLHVFDDAVMLQCGRIYKDAEIMRNIGKDVASQRLLQCGRIYKDAEIWQSTTEPKTFLSGFNVAASIKMRKCPEWRRKNRHWIFASMWPHL